MIMFKIEKGVEIPVKGPSGCGNLVTGELVGLNPVLRSMQIGDSVFVENTSGSDKKKFLNRVSGCVAMVRIRWNKRSKFALRSVEEDGRKGVRVWRVEDRVEAAE
jgi:hypothetical protein